MSLMLLQYFRWEVVFYLDSASTIHIYFAFLKIKAIVHNSTDEVVMNNPRPTHQRQLLYKTIFAFSFPNNQEIFLYFLIYYLAKSLVPLKLFPFYHNFTNFWNDYII